MERDVDMDTCIGGGGRGGSRDQVGKGAADDHQPAEVKREKDRERERERERRGGYT